MVNRKSTNWREGILIGLGILLLITIVVANHLPWNPENRDLNPDSGLYAYLGSAIVHGQVPYRDAWEHKPPIGFYLNALAIRLFGQTPWAIWWFAVLWMSTITTAFFLMIHRMMGWLPAFIGSITFVIAAMIPEMYLGGNLMEIYALAPQILTVYTYYNFIITRRKFWAYLVGVSVGFVLMTRQASLALGISAGIAIMWVLLIECKLKLLWQCILGFGVGFLLPFSLGLVYWSIMDASQEFLDALFFSGMSYASVNVPFLWSIKNTATRILPKMTIGQLYGISLSAIIPYLAINKKVFTTIFSRLSRKARPEHKTPEQFQPLEAIGLMALLALPLEVILASLGGRNFGHYFIAMVPALATITSYIIWHWEKATRTLKKAWWAFAAWTPFVLGIVIWNANTLSVELPARNQSIDLATILESRYTPDSMETYVLERSDPQDTILVWHIHVGLNFVTNRRPPQRILYPALLFVPAERAAIKLQEFLIELKRDPPRLILVQEKSSIGLPFVNVPVADMCPRGACIPELAAAIQRPEVQTELEKLRTYFLEHYVLDRTIGDWLAYRRR